MTHSAKEVERIRRMIVAINSKTCNLTPWEVDFMEGVTKKFEERAFLTSKQCEVLERIYDQRTN